MHKKRLAKGFGFIQRPASHVVNVVPAADFQERNPSLVATTFKHRLNLVGPTRFHKERRPMPTIVRHVEESRRYILVSAGYAKSESVMPHWLLGNLGVRKSGSREALVCICDADGQLFWTESDQVTVECVDGFSPAKALQLEPPDAESAGSF